MSMQVLAPATIDERWLVFGAVKSYPVDLVEILTVTELPHTRTIVTLIALENDGLVDIHHESDSYMEWKLSDA